MSSTDAYALKNSDLNAFLFADVGTELNGSTLTMLSMLARLGQDPWVQAADWTRLPKAAAIICVAQGIGRMPLDERALAEKTVTATRLVLLLPSRSGSHERFSIGGRPTVSGVPNWVPIAFLCVSLLLGIAFNETSPPPVPLTAGAGQPAAFSTK